MDSQWNNHSVINRLDVPFTLPHSQHVNVTIANAFDDAFSSIYSELDCDSELVKLAVAVSDCIRLPTARRR